MLEVLISLGDAEQLWFKARYGIEAREMPRASTFCHHAIRGSGLMVVPDAEQDDRFVTNPDVVGPARIRFYAGAPVVAPEGFVLGTLCVLDRRTRQLSVREAAILRKLGEQVVHELEVRVALGDLYQEVAEAGMLPGRWRARGRHSPRY